MQVADRLALAVGLLSQVVVGVVRVRALLGARQDVVILAERRREIGLRDAAKGVIGERRLVAARVGDAHIDFSISEPKSKAPPFKKRRTGRPKFNYKARAPPRKGAMITQAVGSRTHYSVMPWVHTQHY